MSGGEGLVLVPAPLCIQFNINHMKKNSYSRRATAGGIVGIKVKWFDRWVLVRS